MADLPAGFVLDQATAPAANGLPPGFVLDNANQAPQSSNGYQPNQFWHNVGVDAQPLIAAGYNAAKGVEGMAQGLEHLGGAAGIIPKETVAADDAGMAAREKYYQANIPDNFANNTAGAIGSLAPYVVGGGAALLDKAGTAVAEGASKLIPQALADYSPAWLSKLAPKVVSGASQGADIGALSPVTDNSKPYADQKMNQIENGLMIGAITPVATTSAQALASGLKGFMQPLTDKGSNILAGKTLNDFMGGSPEDNIAKLRGQTFNDGEPPDDGGGGGGGGGPWQIVPGSTPTTAQLAINPDSNFNLVQAEKSIRNTPEGKAAFESQENNNNNARFAALNQVAGEPGQLEAAIKTRADNAAANYGAAYKENPSVMTPQLSTILQRPTAVKALNNAAIMMQDEGTLVGVRDPDLVEQAGLTGTELPRTGVASGLKLQTFDYIKRSLDNMIGNETDNITGKLSQQGQSYLKLKKDLMSGLYNATGDSYKKAIDQYAADSVPINDMQTARNLIDSLSQGSLNSAGEAQATLSQYNSKLKQALNTDYGVSPQAQKVFDNVHSDLQRGTISNSVKSSGSDTNYNAQAPGWLARQVYGPNFEGAGKGFKIASGLLSAGLAHASGPEAMIMSGGGGVGAATMLGNYAKGNVNSALAQALLNPENSANALQAYQASVGSKGPQLSKALLDKLPQLGGLGQ